MGGCIKRIKEHVGYDEMTVLFRDWRIYMFCKKINQSNSSMMVQCDAKEKCEMRHTTLCRSCKHNRGKQKDKNCYEPR